MNTRLRRFKLEQLLRDSTGRIRRVQLGRLPGFVVPWTPCTLLKLCALALFIDPAVGQQEPTWNLIIATGGSASSDVTVTNTCSATHTFEISTDGRSGRFVELPANRRVQAEPGASARIPLTFSTEGLRPGNYSGVISTKCLTCNKEPGCRIRGARRFAAEVTVIPSSIVGSVRRLREAIEKWNDSYGRNVRAGGFRYEGVITSAGQRNRIVKKITNRKKAWFPSIDVANPSESVAVRLDKSREITEEDIANWRNMVGKTVEVGHHFLTLHWTQKDANFTTLSVVDEDQPRYDNMLFNAARMEETNTCPAYRLVWLWGGERGRISSEVSPNCRNGRPITCDELCEASMTLVGGGDPLHERHHRG